LDVSPETIKNTVNYIVGGAGRFITDTESAGELFLSSDENLTANKTPILKSFLKAESIDDYRKRYYSQSDDVTEAQKQLQAYKTARNFSAMQELKKEKGDLLKLIKLNKKIHDQIKILRDKEDELRANDGSREEINNLENREKSLLMRFDLMFKKRNLK